MIALRLITAFKQLAWRIAIRSRVSTPWGLLAFSALCLTLHHCSNPALKRVMIIETKSAQTVGNKKDRKSILLLDTELKLSISSPDADELDALAEKMDSSLSEKFSYQTRNYRLAPLTYFRFDFENASDRDWRIRLDQIRFADKTGQSFHFVTHDAYKQHFKSISYERFRYDALFAAYITATANRAEDPKNWYYHKKFFPGEVVEIPAHTKGFQVLPFDFIPEGIYEVTMTIPMNEKENKHLSVVFITERQDQ